MIVRSRSSASRDVVDGATAVEYALMLSLVAVAVLAAVRVLGEALPGPFEFVAQFL